MEGSGSGCLGRGGLARGIQDPLLQTTSFVRPTPPHAILFPIFHQGKSLGAGVPRSTPQASHRTGPSGSRLLQSPVCGLEGFRGVAPHHRLIHPEHLHRIPAISHWMISLDLQDAYLQVPVHPESRRYLRFTMGGVSYQFRVLCFGLTTAPQVFTRLMAPISAILHRYGIRMLRYLDDWLILAESRTTCLPVRDRLLQVYEELGYKSISGSRP